MCAFFVFTYAYTQANSYWDVLQRGASLLASEWHGFVFNISQNHSQPLSIILIQISIILIVARAFGWLFHKLNQPVVIGEITAGIVLGTSVLGNYVPDVSLLLFPAHSISYLNYLSQIGLIMFMFVIGTGLDANILKDKSESVLVISLGSVLIPFVSGCFFAYSIYPLFTIEGVSKTVFSLFFGIALSFTALPVLARILHEKGMHKSKLGIISITSAAINDFFAWLMLAATIAIAMSDSIFKSVSTIIFAIIYVVVMLKIVRPFLKKICEINLSYEKLNKSVLSIFILLLLLSSYIAEIIGIHALFGAFLAGAIVPENRRFRNLIIGKIEDFTIVLLLPIFFVFTGLRTQFGLITGEDLWLVTILVITVAVIAKFGGSALAAKLAGQNWKDSLTIGALLNTRGLIPLIILNIGLDIGVLNPEIFSILVLMAMITTLMTGPLLSLIEYFFKPKNTPNHKEIIDKTKFKILISFANPVMGKFLLRLANALVRKMNGNASVVATHFYNVDEMGRLNSIDYENNSFALINEESELLNQKFLAQFKAATNIQTSIAKMANEGDFDLLLIGIGQPVFDDGVFAKIIGYTNKIMTPEKLIQQVAKKDIRSENLFFDQRTNEVLQNSNVPVGIFINKSKCSFENIIIPVLSDLDYYILHTAQQFIHNSASQVTFVDYSNLIKENRNFNEQIRIIEQAAPNHISIVSKHGASEELFEKQDLILISPNSWKTAIDLKKNWLQQNISILILCTKSY